VKKSFGLHCSLDPTFDFGEGELGRSPQHPNRRMLLTDHGVCQKFLASLFVKLRTAKYEQLDTVCLIIMSPCSLL
jgi:hypothetical protein